MRRLAENHPKGRDRSYTRAARSRGGRLVDPKVGLCLEEVVGFPQDLDLLLLGEQPHASGGQ